MYIFSKSVCLSRSLGSQWSEVDLSNILVFDIYNMYVKVFLELDVSSTGETIYVDMDTLKTEFSSYNGTLLDLLIHLENRTLITSVGLPNTLVKFAKYSDAVRSQYKIELTNKGVVIPDNYPMDDRHDLKVTRPKYPTSMELLHTHCLMSVNGYFHMTDTDGAVAYIDKGADTLRKSKENHVGIFSFLDVGALTKVPLLKENIIPSMVQTPLRNKITFSVPNDLDDKSYILVLGGYLVFPQENVFWRSGTNNFTLDLNRLPYVERLFESKRYLDLSQLALTQQLINIDGFNTDEVFSDRVLKEYLTLSQSFLVIVDVPNLSINKINIRNCNMPGMFTSYQDPVYPLIVNYGKAAEYWKTHEAGHWSVTVKDSYLRNYVVSQQVVNPEGNITNNLLSSTPFYHSTGFLLEVSGYRNT